MVWKGWDCAWGPPTTTPQAPGTCPEWRLVELTFLLHHGTAPASFSPSLFPAPWTNTSVSFYMFNAVVSSFWKVVHMLLCACGLPVPWPDPQQRVFPGTWAQVRAASRWE